MSLFLGVETSCDETSAAVVEDGRVVKSNVVASQMALHAPFGGVVPEIASRQHVRVITQVVRAAIAESGSTLENVDAICTTYGPGLAGALLVGFNFGRALALGLDVPWVPVHHLDGHIHSVWLGDEAADGEPELPILCLIVSGGHTELVLVAAHGNYQRIGHTVDDAAGEAFDKVARLLGLPYPGGPSLQQAARTSKNPENFPVARMPESFNFSFSGLKTAVLHRVQFLTHGASATTRGVRLPHVDVARGLSAGQIADIAAGFQKSAVQALVAKTALAARELQCRSVAVVGGVAANRLLRDQMRDSIGLPVRIPKLAYCTDNAAMIASAGFFVGPQSGVVDVQPAARLVTA